MSEQIFKHHLKIDVFVGMDHFLISKPDLTDKTLISDTANVLRILGRFQPIWETKESNVEYKIELETSDAFNSLDWHKISTGSDKAVTADQFFRAWKQFQRDHIQPISEPEIKIHAYKEQTNG